MRRTARTFGLLGALLIACSGPSTEGGSESLSAALSDGDGSKRLTLIHIGDLHGHLVPRANVRQDAAGPGTKGGLARMWRKIERERQGDPHSLLINTGDTIQGSAETLYTRGQAIVDVLNGFGIDAFVPGNWDYLYGSSRFLELFDGPNATAPWGGVAANLYYSTLAQDPTTPYPSKAGQRVLPPYRLYSVNGIKVGVLGMTAARGPQVVAPTTMKGFQLTAGDAEVAQFVGELRNVEKVDVLVMISELGLANNIRLAQTYPGIDFVLSSDMHEETRAPVVTSNGTVIVEEGQDGTVFGKFSVRVKDHRVQRWSFEMFDVDESIGEDHHVASTVAEVRKTFVSGPDFVNHENPFNHSRLKRPIDSVVGYTAIPLNRSNFSDQDMPGVIEGSSHDFLTDVFRTMTGGDVGAIRGFRFGTHVPPGPIRLEDLYHYLPTGRQVAVGTITGAVIKNQIENSATGALNPNVAAWTGGWLLNFSGLTMDFNPYGANGARASNVRIQGQALVPTKPYRYASLWYPEEPNSVNVTPATNIVVLKDDDGSPLDATEVVARYLQSLPNQTASPELHRIHLTAALPAPSFGNREIQPLRGAVP